VVDWQPLIKAIFDWIAEATDAERARRIQEVGVLSLEIQIHAARLARLSTPRDQEQIEQTREQIHKLLKSFAQQHQLRSESGQ
jgi:hypothetical protein